MRYFLMLLFISLYATGTRAQNAREDLIGMNKLYHEAERYSMDVEVEISPEEGQKQRITGEVYKEGSNYYSSTNGKTVIVNESLQLIVNDARKTMSLKVLSSGEKQPSLGDFSVEQFITEKQIKQNNIRFVKKEGDTRWYAMNPPGKSGMKDVSIGLGPNNELRHFHYKYKEAGQQDYTIRCNYTDIQINGTIDKSIFSVEAYLVLEDGMYRTSEQYSDYQIQNM